MSNLKSLCESVIAAGEKSTKATWYEYKYEKQVRGPWNRWFQATGPLRIREDSKDKRDPADIEDDVKYAALAMNNCERLARALIILEDGLENADACIRVTHDRLEKLLNGTAKLGGFHTYDEELADIFRNLCIGLKYGSALAKAERCIE